MAGSRRRIELAAAGCVALALAMMSVQLALPRHERRALPEDVRAQAGSIREAIHRAESLQPREPTPEPEHAGRAPEAYTGG